MALILGVPVIVPAVKVAAKRSNISCLASKVASISLTICMTWEYRSTLIISLTFTLPTFATRPRSFRPRSMSIKCSARSFSSLSISFSYAWSFSYVEPRLRVPAMGRSKICPSLSPTITSGELPMMANSG